MRDEQWLLKMKNIPNRITISRIALIFIFVLLANVDSDKMNFLAITPLLAYSCHVMAVLVAILAGLTDLLDGYLARRYGLESDFGRLIDPLADKIFMVAMFVMLCEYGLMPGWMVIVILSREFLVTGLRLLATNKGQVISADSWGKFKTLFQMVVILVGGLGWINLFGFNLFNKTVWIFWYGLLLLMTFVTIASGVGYFVRHRSLYLEST